MRNGIVVGPAIVLASFVACYEVPAVLEVHDAGHLDSGAASEPDAGHASDAQLAGAGDARALGADAEAGDAGGGDGTTGEAAAACTGILCPCDNPTSCDSHVCVQSINIGPTAFSAAGGSSFCTVGCCTSADCPTGTVCFASGQGGQYCLDPAWLGRSKPDAGAADGGGGGGAACATGADCRSGVCAGMQCADTCCSLSSSSAECGNGSVCAFGTFPGKTGIDTHFAPWCMVASGAGTYGAACQNDTDCRGGLCYPQGSGATCTNPCRTQDECGAGNACQIDSRGNDLYMACFPWMPAGALGSACTSDDVCRSSWCGTTNECTGVCFTDADCGSVSGWRCTPQAASLPTGNYLVLACGP